MPDLVVFTFASYEQSTSLVKVCDGAVVPSCMESVFRLKVQLVPSKLTVVLLDLGGFLGGRRRSRKGKVCSVLR